MINITKIIHVVKMSLENVKKNAVLIKDTVNNLKSELNTVSSDYNKLLAQQLREENARLLCAVEDAKQRLIQLEIQNGVQQVEIPDVSKIQASNVVLEQPPKVEEIEAKAKKEKKVKGPKEVPPEAPVDIGRLDLRIGKIINVQRHPNADTLYKLDVLCGDLKTRSVCSGLVNHVPVEELHHRLVVVLCNLKPAKMRGILSEAMIMCASCENGIELLDPPDDSEPGDLVQCDGYNRKPDPIMNPKKKIFETLAPDLHTNNLGQACYKGTPWSVPSKGHIVSQSLKNVPIK